MKNQVEIGDKKLHSIQEALSHVSYTRDYITRLAREGKIVAVQVRRKWYVDIQSLKNYAESSRLEADIRREHLSEQRKLEQHIRKAQQQHEAKATQGTYTAQKQAFVLAGSVLTMGLVMGVFGYALILSSPDASSVVQQTIGVNQNAQTAANAKAVMANNTNPDKVTDSTIPPDTLTEETVSHGAEGILVLPFGDAADPSSIFSDEVQIRTASSGTQTAVLLDSQGNDLGREIPFVVVPVTSE